MAEDLSIEYGIYEAGEAEAVAGVLADVFPRLDPPAFAVGLTALEFEAFVRMLLPMAAEERLTIVARVANTGEIVGAMLSNDPACETAEGMESLSKRFEPIACILGKLNEIYRAGKKPGAGEMLHLYLLGVSDRAAGKGVGHRLVAEAVKNGARRGFRVAVAEATNKKSQGIFRDLGFKECAQIGYGDFVFKGQKVFESIAEEGGPILMEKLLAGQER